MDYFGNGSDLSSNQQALLAMAVAGGGGGGATAWNPSDKGALVTLSNSNRTADCTDSGTHDTIVRATNSHSGTGKYYFEVLVPIKDSSNGFPKFGVCGGALATNTVLTLTVVSNAWWVFGASAAFAQDNAGNFTFTGLAAGAANDVWMVAVDFAAGFIWFGKNGTWNTGGNPATGAGPHFTNITGTLFPFSQVAGTVACQIVANFASANFAFTIPTGFSQW